MALQNVLVLCFSRETPYRFLETSHSTVFKQRFRECELLKDAPNSACRRLETVVLDMTRREYADLRKKVDELNALLMSARIKDGSPVENMNPFLRGFNGD